MLIKTGKIAGVFGAAFSLWILLTAAVQVSEVRAAEVQATVNRTQISLGESLELRVTVAGEGGNVDTGPIRDFKVTGSGTSTSVHMINGNFSREIIYAFTLFPVREGTLTIPALPVRTGGKTVHTDPISITVAKVQSPKQNRDRALFAEAEVSSETPYAGQQIIYTFRFYKSISARAELERIPDFENFTAKPVEDQNQYGKTINGRKYQITELYYVLTPLKAGTVTIGPMILKCGIPKRTRRRSLFDDPFFGGGRMETRRIQTEPVTVNVRPLPPYDGDAPFSGLVGKFSLTAELTPASVKAGESATLSVKISGTGNLMDAAPPEVKIPPDVKSYEDAPEEEISISGRGYAGHKSFKTALVPVTAGEYPLGPVSLVYFDVEAGKYVKTEAAIPALKAAPSETETPVTVTAPTDPLPPLKKKKVEFTGRDILPLKEGMDVLETRRPMGYGIFAFWMLLPGLFFAGVLIVMAATGKKEAPARRMARRAEQALKAAASETGSADGEAFLSPLTRAVVSMILSKAGVIGESLTYAEAERLLLDKGYPQETAKKAAALLAEIDAAKFGGQAGDAGFRQTLLTRTRKLFREISR